MEDSSFSSKATVGENLCPSDLSSRSGRASIRSGKTSLGRDLSAVRDEMDSRSSGCPFDNRRMSSQRAKISNPYQGST
jgi:hypothetical protein